MVNASTHPQDQTIFLETPELDGVFRAAITIDKVLMDRNSQFQSIQVAEAGQLGRLLILDGVIQTSDFDEAAYHEMIVHVPLLAHPRPERVLVIGGGDGGTLREIGRHSSVVRMDICEIDEGVIEASKGYLPELAKGFDDPRVHVHIADGAKYVTDHEATFDVILVDSSDPVGPAQVLFQKAFYEAMKKALKPGGIIVTQSESFWLYAPLLKRLFGFLTELFDRPLYYTTNVPTYPSGVIGFSFCSLGPDPLKAPDPERLAALGPLKYYSPAVARSAFVLPRRALDLLPEKVAAVQAGL